MQQAQALVPLAAGLSVAGMAVLASQTIKVVEGWAEHGTLKFGSLRSTAPKRYYQGGFEQHMSRREAALILGVREYAPHEKIKDAHLKLMKVWQPLPTHRFLITHAHDTYVTTPTQPQANHPDSGGSDLIATKIAEAKGILLDEKSPGSGSSGRGNGSPF
jgi:hypothetical protein